MIKYRVSKWYIGYKNPGISAVQISALNYDPALPKKKKCLPEQSYLKTGSNH